MIFIVSLILQNDRYICIKVNWICDKGVNAYCIKKDDNNSLLIEVKEKGDYSNIKEAVDQIKTTYKTIREERPKRAIIVVHEEGQDNTQIDKYIQGLEVELGIKIDILRDYNPNLNELKDLIDDISK